MTIDSTASDSFDDPPQQAVARDFVIRLESYEGPIDVLLDQARDQKVDLTQISILALAEQYLDFIEQARALRLELAADYLVMAAWLAYLKSRLLLPASDDDEEPSGEELASALAFQLRRLEAMRTAGAALMGLPRLGTDWFARGAPEPVAELRTATYEATLYDLLKAYAHHRRKKSGPGTLAIGAQRLYSMDQAFRRLTELLGGGTGWSSLVNFLPSGLNDPLIARSALASVFAASLEMVRSGDAELRQDGPFQPLYVRRPERKS
ncbi:MAG: segregation and condensation protein A [Inquilinaceae bacterium]